jgi:hypothetical protein
MKAVQGKHIGRRLSRLQTGVLSLSAQIEKGDDSTVILKRAAALVTAAKQLHADLTRDCLAQVLADPEVSRKDADAILRHLKVLLG